MALVYEATHCPFYKITNLNIDKYFETAHFCSFYIVLNLYFSFKKCDPYRIIRTVFYESEEKMQHELSTMDMDIIKLHSLRTLKFNFVHIFTCI